MMTLKKELQVISPIISVSYAIKCKSLTSTAFWKKKHPVCWRCMNFYTRVSCWIACCLAGCLSERTLKGPCKVPFNPFSPSLKLTTYIHVIPSITPAYTENLRNFSAFWWIIITTRQSWCILWKRHHCPGTNFPRRNRCAIKLAKPSICFCEIRKSFASLSLLRLVLLYVTGSWYVS